MSTFRRNLLKNGGGRMIEVTDRYEVIFDAYASGDTTPGRVVKKSNGTYSYVEVPVGRNLYAEVTKPTSANNWPTGMIVYADNEDRILGADAISPAGDATLVVPNTYTRFKLRFPVGAIKAYVNSTKVKPPKIFKKVM